MAIAFEQMEKIKALGLRKHVQIVDGYIATGLDLDDLTIHYGLEQKVCIDILHGYGFGLGSIYGDTYDSKKKYKSIPFRLIENYVSVNYPGLIDKDLNDEGISIEFYLDNYQPNWRGLDDCTKHSMFTLSKKEMEGNPCYNGSKRISKKKCVLGILFNKK